MLIQDILYKSTAQLMEKSIKELAQSDVIYQSDKADLVELEKKYIKMELARDARMFINDYIACMQTSDSRFAELAYMAGISDAIKILSEMRLIERGNMFE